MHDSPIKLSIIEAISVILSLFFFLVFIISLWYLCSWAPTLPLVSVYPFLRCFFFCLNWMITLSEVITIIFCTGEKNNFDGLGVKNNAQWALISPLHNINTNSCWLYMLCSGISQLIRLPSKLLMQQMSKSTGVMLESIQSDKNCNKISGT